MTYVQRQSTPITAKEKPIVFPYRDPMPVSLWKRAKVIPMMNGVTDTIHMNTDTDSTAPSPQSPIMSVKKYAGAATAQTAHTVDGRTNGKSRKRGKTALISERDTTAVPNNNNADKSRMPTLTDNGL